MDIICGPAVNFQYDSIAMLFTKKATHFSSMARSHSFSLHVITSKISCTNSSHYDESIYKVGCMNANNLHFIFIEISINGSRH